MQIQLNIQYCEQLDQYFLFFLGTGLSEDYYVRDIVHQIILASKSVFMLKIFAESYKRFDVAIMYLMMLVDFLEEQPNYILMDV